MIIFDNNRLQSDRSDKLQLTQTGTGGLAELREILEDSKASFAYVRVAYSNDKESTREKFILVVRPPLFSPYHIPTLMHFLARFG